VAVILAGYGLTPTFLDLADGKLDRNVESFDGPVVNWVMEQGTPLTLGLDLQGGLLLQYKVMVDRAVQDKLDQMARDIEARLIEKAEGEPDIVADHGEGDLFVRVEFPDAAMRDLIDSDFMAYFPNLQEIDAGGGVMELKMKEEFIDQTKKFAVQKAIETIRSRVNALGVSEPSITRRGQTDIIVQLPGLEQEDQQRAKDLIGQTARLVFRMVDEEVESGEEQYQSDSNFFQYIARQNADQFVAADKKGLHLRQVGGRYTVTHRDKEALEEFFAGKTDDEHMVGYEYMPFYKGPEKKQLDEERTHWRSLYLFSETKLTGDMISDARVSVDQQSSRPVVSLTFNRKGAELFAELTEANVGKRFAIMLDNEVQSAPVINEAIPGGRAQISMGNLQSYTEIQQEAQDLVIVLRHGALPAPIELQHQTVVGPTLGAQSIQSSSYALLVGTLLIILFMLFYYKGSGVVSVIALLFNLVFIMAALAGLGATLTLPGIAGIILTVGMAVDANVIIFERIREEVREGNPMRECIDSGFEKALSAVIDANVTTGIAALVLMQYGTGPIRGFAVTLLIGIVSTIFTAVFISRLLFDTWTERRDESKGMSI
jgi:preprotein translocase subunit SecD